MQNNFPCWFSATEVCLFIFIYLFIYLHIFCFFNYLFILNCFFICPFIHPFTPVFCEPVVCRGSLQLLSLGLRHYLRRFGEMFWRSVTAERRPLIGWPAGRKCVRCLSWAENKTRRAANGECSVTGDATENVDRRPCFGALRGSRAEGGSTGRFAGSRSRRWLSASVTVLCSRVEGYVTGSSACHYCSAALMCVFQ